MPKQYCIGSTTSKSVYAVVITEADPITNRRLPSYEYTARYTGIRNIFHFPVESRRTLLFSRYFGHSSYEA